MSKPEKSTVNNGVKKSVVKQNQQKTQSQPKAKQTKATKPSEVVDDVKREQKLQAVLFTDNFVSGFEPIDFKNPPVLFPFVNASALDYTLEFLAINGVEEVRLHVKLDTQY